MMKKDSKGTKLVNSGPSKKVGNNEDNTKYVGKKSGKSSGGTGLNEQNSKYC